MGIFGSGTSGNLVQGNDIGTSDGQFALANAIGISLYGGATQNTVNGNCISGNTVAGLDIGGVGTSGNVVENCLVGTDASGIGAIANGTGVLIEAGATGNTIGSGNVISGNNNDGLDIIGMQTSGNVVRGSRIGTDVSGEQGLANGVEGLAIQGAANNTIGGTSSADGNVISGNANNPGYDGILINLPGASGNVVENNLIGMDAADSMALPNGNGVAISNGAANNTIGGSGVGNTIGGNLTDGIFIISVGTTGNLVEGNYLGTDSTGTAPLPNGTGVLIEAGATGNTIGSGNVISGNNGDGLDITGMQTSGNVVMGSRIGTDVSGEQGLANGVEGLAIQGAANNTIGGTSSADGNVISGNDSNPGHDGVLINLSGASGNVVENNLIGMDAADSMALPNGNGVAISNGAANNTIGGSGVGNIIGGNLTDGIFIISVGTTGNLVAGNHIGIDSTGASVPDGTGVLINGGASGNTVGGRTIGAGNVIAGNTGDGVDISGTGTSGNVVSGNNIGVSGTGNRGSGVAISAGAQQNQVGGTSTGAGNNIVSNVGVGVWVFDATSTGDAIRGNSIHDNGKLGIDLGGSLASGPDGPLPNHVGMVSGPNNFQNYPILAAAAAGPTTIVTGSLNALPKISYFLDFYASTTPDPSGYGEGARYLGTTSVTTNSSGNVSFVTSGLAKSTKGEFITATATDPAGNTSEFCLAIAARFGSTTHLAVSPNPATYGQRVTFTATVIAAAGSTGTPTGKVTFLDGATTLGTGTLTGVALVTATFRYRFPFGGRSCHYRHLRWRQQLRAERLRRLWRAGESG